jgi:hypothetical protein
MDMHNIFGSVIYKTTIDPLSYDKDSIVNVLTQNYNKKPHRNKWDDTSKLHHMYGDWQNEEFSPVDTSSLLCVYHKHIEHFMESVSFKKPIKYNWSLANLAVNTEYMKDHEHFDRTDTTQTIFSCTHYISFDKSVHQPTQFINPLPLAYYSRNVNDLQELLNDKTETNSCYFNHWNLDTNEDDFVIFPSYLKHSVLPSKEKTSYPRIVGVVNIDIILK